MNRFAPLVLIPCFIGAACSLGHDNAINAVGSARLTITSVPPAVGCVQLIAAASRTVSESVDVATGETVTLTLSNIPAGQVTFTAFGFAQGCSAIGGAQPNWGSSPTLATIVPGQVTSLQLTLDQVGGANVGISFNTDGGAGDDLGAPPDLSSPPPDLAIGVVKLVPATTLLEFGDLSNPLKLPPPEQDVILNQGTAPSGPLQIQLGGPFGSSFGVTGCTGVVLAPGAMCTLTVTPEVPIAATNVTASLVVSAVPGNAFTIQLHGN
jgi:hypothetical protein